MLGCLISVDEDNLVSLAHYTVKEYLESQRTSGSAVGYFSTGQEPMTKECMRTIFQEAQSIDWLVEKAELLRGDDTGDTPDAFLQDFSVYCVVSSSKSLLSRENVIASDTLLLPLAIDFVNPTLDHFHDICWITESFQDSCLFFSEQNRGEEGLWLFPFWEVQPDSVETTILLHFLLQSSMPDYPMLVHAFVEGKKLGDIAQSNVNFC